MGILRNDVRGIHNMNYIIRGIISLVIFGGFFVVLKFLKTKQIERENHMLEAYMESLEQFCCEMQQKIEATRRYRHDLKGYIQTLETLLGKEDANKEVKQYIEEQKKKHSELCTTVLCRDELMDAIIRMKKDECERKGFNIKVDISDGDYSRMEEMDKVCLITNLLDNAIEATERLEGEKRSDIYLKVEVCGNQMRIYQENGLAKNEEFSFQTKKLDKRNHGLGTAIIEQVLKKYDGTRNLVVDRERHILQDELCLTLKGEAVV